MRDRISGTLSQRFKIPPPPTIMTAVTGNAQVAFSRFRNLEPRVGSSAPPVREEAFVFCASLAATRYARVSLAGRVQSVQQEIGECYLFDMTTRNEISLDGTFDNVRFHIPQTTINEWAYEKGLGRTAGFHCRQFGAADPILHHLARALLPAIETPTEVSTAFAEYMGLAFCEHVFRAYGGISRNSRVSGSARPSCAARMS